ncbi:hypothetical protein AOLI_G00060720 [Acnodon oligacanthus]
MPSRTKALLGKGYISWPDLLQHPNHFTAACTCAQSDAACNGPDAAGSHYVPPAGLVSRGERDLEALLAVLSKTSGHENMVEGISTKKLKLKVKRGIVDQCCHRPCTLSYLQNYCN